MTNFQLHPKIIIPFKSYCLIMTFNNICKSEKIIQSHIILKNILNTFQGQLKKESLIFHVLPIVNKNILFWFANKYILYS